MKIVCYRSIEEFRSTSLPKQIHCNIFLVKKLDYIK
jgi:hypothetical protein